MKESSPKKIVLPKVMSPSPVSVSPPKTITVKTSPPNVITVKTSPPKVITVKTSPPKEVLSPPPVATFKIKRADSKVDENSVLAKANKIEAACSPSSKDSSPPVSGTFKRDVSSFKKDVTSPPVSATFKKEFAAPPSSVTFKKDIASPPVSTFKNNVTSPPVSATYKKENTSPPVSATFKKEIGTAPTSATFKKDVTSPPVSGTFKKESTSPPVSGTFKKESTSPPVSGTFKKDLTSPISNSFKKEVVSPPASATFKIARSDSKENSGPPKVPKRENSLNKEVPVKIEKLTLVVENQTPIENKNEDVESKAKEEGEKNDESNGVGDKIKKFEKAAEDASGVGRTSRPGSGRRTLVDFPPPATPFKDNVHFDLPEKHEPERHSIMKSVKWQRSESHEEKQKTEPKIIKPEFKPMPSPVDLTIRSPSLGAKLPEQFPSHGTAFRNVASPDQSRNAHKLNDDVNTHNNFKSCKFKPKEKSYQVSKGSSYFTRGSEEIWLVKKKDIEEIEERVLDSFRRAGGNVCMRSESMRPASEGGQRSKRQSYSRSESCDPPWAGARAQTLQRQSSVACTCGHDKKPARPRPGPGAEAPRPRSRSHGDDNPQHVLDKYETLV